MIEYKPIIKSIKFLFCISLLNVACTQQVIDPYEATIFSRMEGSIDKSFIKRLEVETNYGDQITINSTGGWSSDGVAAAWIIRRKKLSVVVDKYCTSSCAEYILPAANKIIFANDPLVGFHWNQVSIDEYRKNNLEGTLEYCNFEGSNEIKQLWRITKVNPHFWKETEDRLGTPNFDVSYHEKKCPHLKIKSYKKALWFPTSKQLSDMFKLKFTGSLCADHKNCYQKKISETWKRSDTYIVGNEEFVVQYPGEITAKELQLLLDKRKR